jgi:hypothetical protein
MNDRSTERVAAAVPRRLLVRMIRFRREGRAWFVVGCTPMKNALMGRMTKSGGCGWHGEHRWQTPQRR